MQITCIKAILAHIHFVYYKFPEKGVIHATPSDQPRHTCYDDRKKRRYSHNTTRTPGFTGKYPNMTIEKSMQMQKCNAPNPEPQLMQCNNAINMAGKKCNEA